MKPYNVVGHLHMVLLFSRKLLRRTSIVGLILVVGIGVIVWRLFPAHHKAVVTTDSRQTYANLYQAAWRQDDGLQSTLVTATLFVPPTIQALGKDTGRSSAEEQLWQAVQGLSVRDVPIVLTFDSVTGAVPDSVLTTGLTLTSVKGPTFTFKSWTPMIAPSRVVNTNDSATSQIGVAIFSANQDVNWQTIESLQLTLHGIPSQPDRVFSWTEPRLLLQM